MKKITNKGDKKSHKQKSKWKNEKVKNKNAIF